MVKGPGDGQVYRREGWGGVSCRPGDRAGPGTLLSVTGRATFGRPPANSSMSHCKAWGLPQGTQQTHCRRLYTRPYIQSNGQKNPPARVRDFWGVGWGVVVRMSYSTGLYSEHSEGQNGCCEAVQHKYCKTVYCYGQLLPKYTVPRVVKPPVCRGHTA